MPSAKNAFSFSSLRFSNGNTAIDLSHLWAETRGKRKNPAAAEITTPVSTSMTTFRRRCDLGTAWRRANALRSDVVRPGKDERNWKAHQQQHDHQTQHPVRQFPCRKRG